MEHQYRHAEGQLDLPFGPPYGKPANRESWFWRKLPIIVIAIVIAMLWAPVAFAFESKSLILTKAIICNTEDELKNQVDVLSSYDAAQAPMHAVEGCGELMYPVPAVVTPTEVYENKFVIVMMATIQIPDMPIQYGYVAWEAKPPEEGI